MNGFYNFIMDKRSRISAPLFMCREGFAVETIEKIPVYIYTERGKVKCVCHADRKGCGRNCQPDVVTRDKYRGWKETMLRDRYGK